MSSLQVSLSADAQRFVEEQAAKRGLANSGEFLERLVLEAMEREGLEEKLVAGLASGPVFEADDAYWDRKRTELTERARQGRGERRG
jgi:hypothetical protein